MITENEIIEIIKEEINIVNFDITYGKSIWIDNKDLQNIASAIIDKIKEGEKIMEYKYPKNDITFTTRPYGRKDNNE